MLLDKLSHSQTPTLEEKKIFARKASQTSTRSHFVVVLPDQIDASATGGPAVLHRPSKQRIAFNSLDPGSQEFLHSAIRTMRSAKGQKPVAPIASLQSP